jgi:RNA polymerase sigma-70 factor (ECF subfamily)
MAADHTATTHAAGHDLAKPPPQARFAATRWTVVLTAARSDTTRGRDALAQLCQMYWYPLYAYVRRKGYSPPDAEDLTQAFFAQVLRERLVASADREKGRFRSFLLTRLNHFLADEWDRLKAQKRGGGERVLALEITAAETRFQLEPVDWRSPDRLYEHRWALTLLERVFDRLRQEYRRDGKATLFEETKGCLAQARAAVPYAEAGARLGLSEGALRVAVHRLRQRYRELLRAEVADTVSGPEEVEEELRYLFRVLAG